MKLRERTRAYSFAMALLNAGVAAFLFYLSRISVSSGVGGALISSLGPALTVVFALVTVGWLVDAARPGELGDVLPKLRPRPKRSTGPHPEPGDEPLHRVRPRQSPDREQPSA